jgi:hypothetical protein
MADHSRPGKARSAISAAVIAFALSCASAMAAEPVSVEFSVRDANTRLDLAWKIVNRGETALLALVRPLRHDDEPATQSVYVGLGADGVVEFALKAFAVPEGETAAVLDRIGGVPLAAGATIEGRAQAELPLARREPYRRSAVLPPGSTQARLCIGVVEADARIPVSSRRPDGLVATYHDRVVAGAQRVVCSAAVELPGRGGHASSAGATQAPATSESQR